MEAIEEGRGAMEGALALATEAAMDEAEQATDAATDAEEQTTEVVIKKKNKRGVVSGGVYTKCCSEVTYCGPLHPPLWISKRSLFQ